jgi:hypothetical protein
MEPMAGIEPATDGLRNRCSTTELHWLPFEAKLTGFILEKSKIGRKSIRRRLNNSPVPPLKTLQFFSEFAKYVRVD